jgi:8-oxo-dGTP pyrophosphatase MutT (NUDIX family)
VAIQSFNVGVKGVIVQEGQILLVKHATKGFWDIPGGRIDDDESVEQTLRRELAEELPNGKLNAVGKIVCAFRVPDLKFDDGSSLLLLVYLVDIDFDGMPSVSSEHSEYRWATFDEAAKIGSHIVKEVVKALSDE